jgi:hypothetical protein
MATLVRTWEIIIIIITFTREGPVGFHQPRQIAPREGPRVLVATGSHMGRFIPAGMRRLIHEK